MRQLTISHSGHTLLVMVAVAIGSFSAGCHSPRTAAPPVEPLPSNGDIPDGSSPESPGRSDHGAAPQTGEGHGHGPSPSAEGSPPGSPNDTAPVSDAKLDAFVKASVELSTVQQEYVESVKQASSPQEASALQAQVEAKAQEVLESHDLNPSDYKAIADRAIRDPAFRDRVQQRLEVSPPESGPSAPAEPVE